MKFHVTATATALAIAGGTSALAQVAMISNLPGSFVDISGTGTPLSLIDDGEVAITTTIGNSLLAAGSVAVGSNGGIRFDGTSLALGVTNGSIPSTTAFDGEQCLLPFWDDFDTDSGNDGEIYWQEIGGVLYFQWDNAAFFPGGGDTATLQVQVFSTGPAYAQFLYQDVMQPRPDGGGSATIGYQAGGIQNDAQWSFNTPASVGDGTVLSLVDGVPHPAPCGGLEVVDSMPGAFIDISGTGTPLSLGDDAEVDIVTTVTNAIWNPTGGIVRVGSNGGIRGEGAGADLFAGNSCIPGSWGGGTSQGLLAFWDDVDTEDGLWGEIYWEEVAGTLIVQWQDVAFFPGSGTSDTATFQIQVPSAGPVLAQMIYTDIEQARPDGGASATIGYQSGGIGTDAEWSCNVAGAVSNGTVLTLIASAGLGTNYCGPAIPNSSGLAATMQACGSAVVAANDLTIQANDLPAGEFGYFLVGRTQGFFLPMNSAGAICLQGDIGRYNGLPQIITGPTGTLTVDLGILPTNSPGSQVTIPGDTLNFQCWYRDGGTNNFTDGLSILFL